MTWDFAYGNPFTDEIKEKIFAATEPKWVAGLSILGGEPFEPENQGALLEFLKEFKEKFPQKNIWCYSGFNFDGRFMKEKKNIRLKFRGSENQRIIDVKKTLETGGVVIYLD